MTLKELKSLKVGSTVETDTAGIHKITAIEPCTLTPKQVEQWYKEGNYANSPERYSRDILVAQNKIPDVFWMGNLRCSGTGMLFNNKLIKA